MKDEWLIKILLAIIIGLISWSAHREISRLDQAVTVLHGRISDLSKSKADGSDLKREVDFLRLMIRDLKKK